jgi:hypothetical protein
MTDGERGRQRGIIDIYIKEKKETKREADKFSSLILYSDGGSKYLEEKYEF